MESNYNKNKFDKLLSKYDNDIENFIEEASINELVEFAEISADSYYNDESLLDDGIYDILVERIKTLDPNNKYLKNIGSKPKDGKVKLPYHMGSMDKFKSENEKEISKWMETYGTNGKYIYSDKLDGISALFVSKKTEKRLYKRGDNMEGTDISHIIKYIPELNNFKSEYEVAIRGELIMSKETFKKYDAKNVRNMVNGITIKKTTEEDKARDVEFVAYELVTPWEKSFEKQLKLLEKTNMKIVKWGYIDNLSTNILTALLKNRFNESKYDIDGIIITTMNNISRNKDGNPEYSFAYKDINLLNIATTEVIDIVWNVSKDKLIKPTILIKPILLDGVEIKRVTGNNARYVYNNKIGKGTILEIIRSGGVIPMIKSVIKPSIDAKMPSIKWEWNDTFVDAISVDENFDAQVIKLFVHFCSKVGIAGIKEGIATKLINGGINDLHKLINSSELELKKILGPSMTTKIYNNINDGMNKCDIITLMVGSNIFGHNIGNRKINSLIDKYPKYTTIFNSYDTQYWIENLNKISGFDTITSTQIVNNTPIFIEFFNKLSKSLQNKILNNSDQNISNQNNLNQNDLNENDSKLRGKNVVFSGFRDSDLQMKIVNKGGVVADSVTKSTNILVIKDEEELKNLTNKVIKANKNISNGLDTIIMTKVDFITGFIGI